MRKIPLSPQAVEMLEEQLECFESRFGRKPLPGEPIAFDTDSPGDTPRPLDPVSIMKQLTEALRASGVGEALIYAVEKTGLLLTPEAYAVALSHIREEWDAALLEYQTRKGG